MDKVVPDPHGADTLPVALERGEPEKISAVRLDLAGRGVQPGFTISSIRVEIREARVAGPAPPLSEAPGMIGACAIAGLWSPGRAEPWTRQPPHEETACVEGSRKVADGVASWTFDMTPVASLWAEPTLNRGFMLVGLPSATPAGQTWQIHLERPVEDDPQTTANEYDSTRDRLTFSISFSPPPAQAPRQSPPPPVFGGGPPPPTISIPGDPVVPAPPQHATPGVVPPTAPTPVGAGVRVAVLPQIVWTLVPVGLLLLAVITWIIWEPDPYGRPMWMRAMGFDRRVDAPSPMDDAGRSDTKPVGGVPA